MEAYSLNKLIAKLLTEISEMEMFGFDPAYDGYWTGKGEFDIEFSDGIVAVYCSIEKMFEPDTQKVSIDKIYIQLETDKVFLSKGDVVKIEKGLEL